MMIYLYCFHSKKIIHAACVAVKYFNFMSNTKKLTLFATNVKKNENQVRKNEISRRRKRVLQILIIDPESAG